MSGRKKSGKTRGVKYLVKIEEFLKSLRDLEEDLLEALQSLGGRPVHSEAPESEQPGSADRWDWAATEPIRPSPVPDSQEKSDDPDYQHEWPGDDDDDQCPEDANIADSCSPPRVPCGNQVIVNGQLEIPECKPDAEAILRFKPVCKVTDWQTVHTVDGRKVVVTGIVEIGVEYVADMPNQPLHFVHFVVPFHTFFLCPHPLQGIRCDVEFKHSELLNPRLISKVVLLNVRGIKEK